MLPNRGTHAVSQFSTRLGLGVGLALTLAWPAVLVAQRGDPQEALRAQRNAVEKQLEAVAIIDRSVMVPMRDGKRMLADVYRPKNSSGPVPIVFVRTPYNFNWWDVKNGAPSDMSRQLEAVRRGYAYVEMDERGHFYSEGNYDILGPPRTDGDDAIKWMASQPWSNGKVGLTGCSSTAEWQLGVVTEDNPGLATFNVQGFGAGVGRVGPYYEQGN
ncbi:MAG: CocE/NonD family hydrolase, partial [Gemmatimonadaceae bacterium]